MSIDIEKESSNESFTHTPNVCDFFFHGTQDFFFLIIFTLKSEKEKKNSIKKY